MAEVADHVPNVASTLIDTLIASNRGDRHAFSYNDKRYSYQDVAALMNRTGNLLHGLGVEAGSRVLLLLPASPARVAGMLGAIKAGMVPVLGAPAQALEHCIAIVKPAAAIVHEKYLQEAEAALAALPSRRRRRRGIGRSRPQVVRRRSSRPGVLACGAGRARRRAGARLLDGCGRRTHEPRRARGVRPRNERPHWRR